MRTHEIHPDRDAALPMREPDPYAALPSGAINAKISGRD